MDSYRVDNSSLTTISYQSEVKITMSTFSARLVGGLAALTLVFGGLLVSSASAQTSAQAGVQVTCLTQWFAKDFELGHGTNGSNPIHTGPYGECPITASVGNSRTLIYDCYVINNYGNKWTHVRVSQSTIQGWVYNPYLSGGGANTRC
jgi:hypothetical protein